MGSAILTESRNKVEIEIAAHCVQHFTEPASVIIKQQYPCGVAIANSLSKAYVKAYQCDPTSAEGGIIALNRTLEKETLLQILNFQSVNTLIAPEFSKESLAVIEEKKPNINLLIFDELERPLDEIKQLTTKELRLVTLKSPTPTQIQDLLFAWTVGKFVKPNGIVYASGLQTLGISAGPNRFFSARLGIFKAEMEGLTVQNAVMASEGIFTSKDIIDSVAKEGIQAIIQPGGSPKDAEIIEAANKHQIAMMFTHIQYFRT